MPCSPRICSRPPQGRSGRALRRLSPSCAICEARSASIAPCMSSPSSWRCCGVRQSMSRCWAAARRARSSTSSSSDCGPDGKNSPCCSMKSANCCAVSSPRASASSIALRSASMSLTACMPSGVAPSSACFIPRNWLSSTSLRSRSSICSYASRASGLRHAYGASSRTARAVSRGSVSSSISAIRAASDGSGNSACFSSSTAFSSSARTSSRVPSSRPLRRASRWRLATLRRRSSRPRSPSVPCRSRSRRACRGLSPASTRSPISSSALATSYGGSSGSRPPAHSP